MKLSNAEMETMLNSLEPLLDRTDIIGYAAARNYRKLQDGCQEYLSRKRQIINEYGEKEYDEDGNVIGIRISDEQMLAKANEDISVIVNLCHDVEIYQIPIGEAVGKLSGRELLLTEFMFREDEDHAN